MGVSVLTRISHEEHVHVFTAKVVLSAVVSPGQGYGPSTHTTVSTKVGDQLSHQS